MNNKKLVWISHILTQVEFLEWIYNEFCLYCACSEHGNSEYITTGSLSSPASGYLTLQSKASGSRRKLLTTFLIGGWEFQIPLATNLDILTHNAYPDLSCYTLRYLQYDFPLLHVHDQPIGMTRLHT